LQPNVPHHILSVTNMAVAACRYSAPPICTNASELQTASTSNPSNVPKLKKKEPQWNGDKTKVSSRQTKTTTVKPR
jgi:hypothetical protein